MSAQWKSQTGLDPEPMATVGGNAFIAHGTTVPSDGAVGYTPGCLFIHRDGSAGGVLYVNDGSATSSDFNVVTGTGVNLSGLTATAAELNASSDVSERIVNVTDAATYSVLAANSGKPHIVPDFTATCTMTLPTAAAGLEYEFYSKAVAADAQDWRFSTGGANFFLGGLAFADTDAGAAADEIHAGVFPNGSSNDFVTIVTPGAGTRIKLVCDGTNWIISGIVFSATVPAFADT